MNEQHHAPNPGGIGVGMGWKGLVDHLIEGGMLVGLESLSLRTQRGYGLIDVRPDTTHTTWPAHQPELQAHWKL
ncbi:hypothetical protein ACU6RQ_00575 [Zobellella denitrificans]